MISLKRTYKTARARLEVLWKTSPPDEAFILTVFFVEKIIRRTLLQLVIRKGKTKEDAVKYILGLNGIWKVKNAWPKWDTAGRSLESIVGQPNWDVIADAAKKRNDLVHGSGNEGQKSYSRALPLLLAALDAVKQKFAVEYKYFGWRGMKDKAGNPI